jgi:hypothetical protein
MGPSCTPAIRLIIIFKYYQKKFLTLNFASDISSHYVRFVTER